MVQMTNLHNVAQKLALTGKTQRLSSYRRKEGTEGEEEEVWAWKTSLPGLQQTLSYCSQH